MAKPTKRYSPDPEDPIFTEGFSITSIYRLTKPVQKDKPGKTPAAPKPTSKKRKSKLG